MTRRGRHRASSFPDTLDGDADFFGLTYTQREHYTERNFTHRWAHQPHDDRWAFLGYAAGWCVTAVATVLLLWWVLT